MSNLMDKISNKLGGNDSETQNQGFPNQNSQNQGGRPSSNTRSNQRGMGQQDQTYATQDQQGYDQSGPQGYSGNQQSAGYSDLNQQGLQQGQQAGGQQTYGNQGLKGDKYQSGGMYDEDPTWSSGSRKAGTQQQQQGLGNTGTTGQQFTQSGEPLGSQFDDDIQGGQQQFQRRF